MVRGNSAHSLCGGARNAQKFNQVVGGGGAYEPLSVVVFLSEVESLSRTTSTYCTDTYLLQKLKKRKYVFISHFLLRHQYTGKQYLVTFFFKKVSVKKEQILQVSFLRESIQLTYLHKQHDAKVPIRLITSFTLRQQDRQHPLQEKKKFDKKLTLWIFSKKSTILCFIVTIGRR